MTLYLLDTDCVIDVLAVINASISFIGALTTVEDTLCTCDVVVGEVYSGMTPDERHRANEFLTSLRFLPTSFTAAQQAGTWRYDYARRGMQLSMTDCLTAAVALEHRAQLVSGNTKDFPMPELVVIDLPRNRRQRGPH